LCIALYVTAADPLPEPRANARRELTDAEVVTLAVAQVAMGIQSDRRFLAVARVRRGHLFPRLPRQSGYFKRRRELREAISSPASSASSRTPPGTPSERAEEGRARPHPAIQARS